MKWTFPSVAILSVLAAVGCKKSEKTEPEPKSEKSEPVDPKKAASAGAPLSAGDIGEAAGTKATLQDDGVVRIGWSRTDVAVKVDGAPFPAAAGLGSWAGFKATADGAMVMGDTVVFEDEISPAIDAAFAGGLEVTALHNHFIYDDPPAFFMHIGGHGDPKKLAASVKGVWDAIRKRRAEVAVPARGFGGQAVGSKGSLNAKAIGDAVGHTAQEKPGGVVKVAIGREASMHGTEFGKSMGLATWIAFAGSDQLATIDGDFAMKAAEVQPVLRALRAAGIHVVALHNHMVGDQPAYFFVHFWGKGKALELARGFRKALGAQAASRVH